MTNEEKQHSSTGDNNSIILPGSSSSRNVNLERRQLRLSDGKLYEFTSNDFIDHGEIGGANVSSLYRMEHEKSGTMMAVKRIYSIFDKRIQKKILDELDVFMNENTCPHIVQFYGALFQKENLWICMELMDTSLDWFYIFVYHKLHQFMPENVVAYITLAVVNALDYLKFRWKIIHRNLKASNILVSKTRIKLCDFEITFETIDNCNIKRDDISAIYLPPERIDSSRFTSHVHDDPCAVWSLGIIIYEISTGHYPFREWKSVFDLLQLIVEGPPLKLTADRLSDQCKIFVNSCLNNDENQRPGYKQMLEHPFLQQTQDVSAYLSDIIDALKQNTNILERDYYLPSTSQ